jgi:hypothetical protein
MTRDEYVAFLDSLQVTPTSLYFAALRGRENEVMEILMMDPTVDVNWRFEQDGRTALHGACFNGRSKIVSMLLAHPDVDVNKKSKKGETPFMLACKVRDFSILLMLRDSRVQVNEPENGGSTPLTSAAREGELDVIQWWIATGREIDLGTPGDEKTDVILATRPKNDWDDAGNRRRKELASLLERFRENPSQVRHKVRLKLDWYNQEPPRLFAVVVFLSDGLLQVKGNQQNNDVAKRFLNIARRLPLELQMILCHCAVGSTGMNISGRDSEDYFKDLAEVLVYEDLFRRKTD